jgi:hypothetical protein
MTQNFSVSESFGTAIVFGLVSRVSEGFVFVSADGVDENKSAGLLRAADKPCQLSVGDQVLIWQQAEAVVVLGRVDRKLPEVASDERPDELVLEANKNLTLKCGDGSITMRNDGKVLIKGKDLVSRAQQSNRIKGGSVSIN